MVSRLETIAKWRGLGSHLSPTETTCYLTSDMFYLEVMLLPGGGVEDVKVAHHGEAPAHLEKDLIKISQLPRPLIHSSPHVDVVLNGRIGNATPRREGHPLSLEYYISPYDLLTEIPSTGSSGRVALVTVGASDSTHRLQRASLIPTPPQINLQGLPVCSPMDEVTSEVLPACFFLKLQPPLPMLSSFIHKMHLITETSMCEADLQWLPFPELLMGTSLRESICSALWEGDNAHFLVPLPENQMHSYVLSRDSWGIAALKGRWCTASPSPTPSMSPCCWSCLDTRLCSTPYWPAVSAPTSPSQVQSLPYTVRSVLNLSPASLCLFPFLTAAVLVCFW
ncbi:hypothetical protein MATL_G00037430 [Megalops atlanticus]|uniref:Mediator of RNA polymerase II transcription subunit 1 n=1 Tax=Megalops atlanticus TaxID=7932 RepID=A0A9D3QHY3_MEGAT|nr:hypothetical protein MATL_G00037430 [Megalops atlanticus]